MTTENTDVLVALQDHASAFEAKTGELAADSRETRDRLFGLEQEVADLKHGGAGTFIAPASPSPAEAFIKSAQLDAMRQGANGTGRVTVPLEVKAISNTGRGQSGDDAYDVPAQRWAGLGNNPQRPLSLFDMLPSLRVSSGSFEYMRLDGYANAAAPQAKEGDTKAEASVPAEVVTAKITTIAHFVHASLQVLDDAPALTSQLNNLLRYGVLAKLESEIIGGDGSAGGIEGLTTLGTSYTATADAAADKVGEAITKLQSDGYQPSVVVLNPADWFAITSERATGDGQYMLGSPRDPAPPALWNVPVILSPALAEGTAIVMDAQQTALLERADAVVSASREAGSNFTSNMLTVLAEIRSGLAVFSPGAVLVVDLTDDNG